MKNSKLRRVLLLLASAVLLVSLSVGATLAYLTSQTDTVTNTFTVGSVKFDDDPNTEYKDGLDEGRVYTPEAAVTAGNSELHGTHVDQYNDRVIANEYKLVPGKTYDKDPTVHISADSEACYVFVKLNKVELTYTNAKGVEVNIEDQNYTSIADQIINHNWVLVDADENVYMYETEIDPAAILANDPDETQLDLVVFENFKVAGDAQLPEADTDAELKALLDQLKITVNAYAIQSEGIVLSDETTRADVWEMLQAELAY